MQRRDFITILGIAAACPMAARAQQSTKVHRIAVAHPSHPLSELTENGGNPNYRVFFEELRSLGYAEGNNLAVARYSGGGLAERYAEVAREVVRTKPEAIFALSSRMVLDFKGVTNTIPIVGVTGDPIALGVAESLARPGGNFTGAISDTGPEYYAKLLELLKEALPTISSVGFIASPAFWGSPLGIAMRDAAPHLGIELIPNLMEHYEEADYRKAFGTMAQRRVDAVLTSDQSENFTRRRLIVELAATNRLPTMTPYLETVEIGGLIAYAPDRKAQFRYVASRSLMGKSQAATVALLLRGQMLRTTSADWTLRTIASAQVVSTAGKLSSDPLRLFADFSRRHWQARAVRVPVGNSRLHQEGLFRKPSSASWPEDLPRRCKTLR